MEVQHSEVAQRTQTSYEFKTRPQPWLDHSVSIHVPPAHLPAPVLWAGQLGAHVRWIGLSPFRLSCFFSGFKQ